MPQLSSRASSLLAAERSSPEDEALKRRVLARAQAVLEKDRASGFSWRPSSAPSERRRAWRTLALAAATVGAASLAAAGAGLFQDQEDARSVSPLRSAALRPAPTTGVAVGGALPLGPAPAPIQTEPPQVTRQRSGTLPPSVERARPSAGQQYTLELSVLNPARSKISRGDYTGALAAITSHQREFPSGLLAEEREALRVRALWGMGQVPAAEAAAKAFRKRYPRSLLLGWMKKTAESPP